MDSLTPKIPAEFPPQGEQSLLFGRIISSVAGNYTVKCDNGNTLICKAKGLFRLKKISPCAGDFVTLDTDGNEYIISEIHERKNLLVRPPLANLDCAVIVVSACEPKPNPLIIDRMTVIFDCKGIESVLVFSKTDLVEPKKALLIDVYQSAGFACFFNYEISRLTEFLCGKTSALIGNTGVGKTSLINRLIPGLELPTAEISKKLGRGKHTTRTVEFRFLENGGYIADTPGFSTVDVTAYSDIPACEVALHFREFAPFLGKCKFGGCTHNGEEGCVICAAVESGETGGISQGRYDSYVSIYAAAKRAEQEF